MRHTMLIIAIVAVLAFGLAEGRWTDRWQSSSDVEAAAAKLKLVPAIIGDWESQEEELDQRQMVKAELNGSLLRHYTHRTQGTLLTVLLVCGKPGPVSVHTPDVCFVGTGHKLTDVPTAQPVSESRPAQFMVAKFRKGEDAIAEYIRAFWSWSTDGDWSSPNSPRLAFARAPALYKLYVIRPMARSDERLSEDPVNEFLRVFLPQLREFVFPASDKKNTVHANRLTP